MKVSPYAGEPLKTIADVHSALNKAEKAREKSESDFLIELRSFWLDIPSPNADPWSVEYRKYWDLVYQELSGREYEVQNEFFDFDVEFHSANSYPFCTEDFDIVSNQLIAIGNIIKSMALPAKSSILEMGAGWGNTSLLLAQMGYDVTVLDINPMYGEVIGNKAKSLGVNVNFHCGEFQDSICLNRKYDAVLFFESFHHSNDHLALLDLIPLLLNDGGILVLAGEPINENLPYDWGLNPAGEALWQITRHGWFELVFRESYLLETLRQKGFSVELHEMADSSTAKTIVCRKNSCESHVAGSLRLRCLPATVALGEVLMLEVTLSNECQDSWHSDRPKRITIVSISIVI